MASMKAASRVDRGGLNKRAQTNQPLPDTLLLKREKGLPNGVVREIVTNASAFHQELP